MLFVDRQDAGRRLAVELLRFAGQRPVVLALPRGGVPVGFEVARELAAPLDVILVRKIGLPWQPELAVGAIVDGERLDKVIDEELVNLAGVLDAYMEAEIAKQIQEIERRRKFYFKGRRPTEVRRRTAIVVDDGIATGSTMRAALRAIRRRGPARLVLAVPVAPEKTVAALRSEVDELVCLFAPDDFLAIGQFYGDFCQVSDEEVVELLDRAAALSSRDHSRVEMNQDEVIP